MNVFLLMPKISGRYGRPSCPPVGLGYLIASLKSQGHKVAALDLRVEPSNSNYIQKIKDFKPDLIGISFTSCNYQAVYSLIKLLKLKIWIPVVIGGPHVSVKKDAVLKECAADYAVYGEGEAALAGLANGMSPKDIKSLIWRKGEEIIINPQEDFISNLDNLPFPEYEPFGLEKYSEKKISLTTARGCPHFCVYCAVDLVIGRRFRMRSVKSVVEEIEHWYSKGYKKFGFNDDTFTENPKRAEQICDELIRRNLKISWDLRTGIRVDRVNKILLEKIKKAGCDFVAFGIESFDKKVLENMRKGTTPQQALEAVKMAKAVGLGVGGFFMIGNPGDSYTAFRRTYEFARQPFFDEVRFYNVEPYPGTQLYQWIEKNNYFLVSPEHALNYYSRWQEKPIFATPDFPAKERVRAFNDGEILVVTKLLNKVFGQKAGSLMLVFCYSKFLRRMILNIGFKSARIIAKFKKTL